MSRSTADYEKEAYIEGLFSAIAPRYDLLNTVLSFAMHKSWRRFAVSVSGLKPGGSALDVCCGTGDFVIELARRGGEGGRAIGVDFSLPMIELARRKTSRGIPGWVSFVAANACRLPFADCSFDCVTVGFGLRNVADIRAAIGEMARVVKPGGRVVCLEVSHVRSRLLALPWKLYFYALTPYTARLFRGKREAYEYLPRSVKGFMSREDLKREFETCGLRDVDCRDLTFGAVCVHVGTKPH